jgi:(p)ppGpp synthase/HD superfamily hydrolase
MSRLLHLILATIFSICLLSLNQACYAKEAQPVIISDRYKDALQFAFDLHQQQTRKGSSIPYLSHLESVASIVWKNGGSETEAIAALLHDAAEDQGGLKTLKLIEEKFGKEVAQIVANCSDTFEMPKPEWKKRKQDYIDALPQHSSSTLLVSAADKLDNIRDLNRDYDVLGEKMWARFSGTRDQTLWYYRTLAAIYIKHGPTNLGKDILAQLDLLETKIKATIS